MTRTYSELLLLPTFEERFEYLSLSGKVCDPTFGSYRLLNQRFYRSAAWRRVKDMVILRDNACDLGVEDRQLFDHVMVHHMNPITPRDIREFNPDILDPEFLITVSHSTHNAIHYGDKTQLVSAPVERRPNDTSPWRKA